MIKVTKIGGDEIVINADLIETVQATPDTIITLTTSKKILVQDSVEEVIAKAVEYHRQLASAHIEVEEE
ncbi:MAG: flagellar FlbD family protein [Bacillota bacterium]